MKVKLIRKVTTKKEVKNMDMVIRQRCDLQNLAAGMDKYLEELKELQKISEEEARQQARRALIDTGVLTKTGKTKGRIVTWE